MSEGAETPRVPEEPSKRLEDLPEFQALSDAEKQRVLEVRDRLLQEASEPKAVVSRSINEMGFWEGLKETVKPHLTKQKEIMFKELKANASLAISLIPVLGEGKGLGTGLFGITAKEGKALTKASQLSDIRFEPLVRVSKAATEGKKAFLAAKGASAAETLLKSSRVTGNVFEKAAMKTADALSYTGAVAKDTWKTVGGALAGKAAIQGSLVKDFSDSASHGASVMAERFKVGDIAGLQKEGAKVARAEYTAKKAEEIARRGLVDKKWWDIGAKFQAWGAERVAKKAMKDVKIANAKQVQQVIEAGFEGRNLNAAQKFAESTVKKAAPKVIEATRFGQFKAFAERWLDFTPDIPLWVSTTTGILEFLGAHGLDALPAMAQMVVNRYQSMKVSTDMAVDVLRYTAGRAIGKMAERKAAAEVLSS